MPISRGATIEHLECRRFIGRVIMSGPDVTPSSQVTTPGTFIHAIEAVFYADGAEMLA